MLKWDEIIGHKHNKTFLRRCLQHNRVTHAYIFAGPSGIGKATLARVYGAALLCDRSSEGEACGQCYNCTQLQSAFHPDLHVVEPIEGALRIDQVRDIQKRLALKPFSSRRKVAIIEGADKLTEQAQNALLKLMEEPPEGTVIILIVTEWTTLLPTIRSRCQTVRFQPLLKEEVYSWLKQSGMSDDEAVFIGNLSEGSIGEAMRLIEDEALHVREAVIDWIDGLAGQSREGIRTIITIGRQLDETKEKIDGYLLMLTHWLKDVLLVREGLHDLTANKDAHDRLIQHEQLLRTSDIGGALGAVHTARTRLGARANFRMTIDAMLVTIQRNLAQGGPPVSSR